MKSATSTPRLARPFRWVLALSAGVSPSLIANTSVAKIKRLTCHSYDADLIQSERSVGLLEDDAVRIDTFTFDTEDLEKPAPHLTHSYAARYRYKGEVQNYDGSRSVRYSVTPTHMVIDKMSVDRSTLVMTSVAWGEAQCKIEDIAQKNVF